MRKGVVAMTLFLVVTLLTHFGYCNKVDTIKDSESQQQNFSSKKRILERLLRLGFSPDSQRKGNTVPYLIQPISNTNVPQLNSSFLKWYQTNQLPDGELHQLPKDNPAVLQRTNYSYIDYPNVFPGPGVLKRDAGYSPKTKSSRTLLGNQYDQYYEHSLEDSALFRRHAVSSTKREKQQRNKRKREQQKKRSKKKKQRRRAKRRLRKLLQDEDFFVHNFNGESFIDCCPSKLIVVERLVGKNRNNHAVEVEQNQQLFYERICLAEVDGRECVFPDRTLRKNAVTRCAQQFSYVQAQVRAYKSDQNWHLDYIQLRSGCSCQVGLNDKNRKKRKYR